MGWLGRSELPFQGTGFPLRARPAAASLPILRLAALFTLASALLVGWALAYLRAQEIETGRRLTDSLAQVIAEQTTRSLQTVDDRLQLAASRLQALQALQAGGGLDEGAARSLLREQLRDLPYARAMWVLDREGRIVLDSDAGNIGVSLADRDYFQAYLRRPATMHHIGAVVRSRSTGQWLVSVSRALRNLDGSFNGLIVAAVEPPHFVDIWRSIDLGSDGTIALFRRDGILMMRSPHDDKAMGQSFAHTALFTQYLAAAHGTVRGNSMVDGRERLIAWRVLPAYPELVVAVGSSLQAVLSPWRRFATLTAMVWLAAVAASAALVRLLLQQARRRREGEQRFRQIAQAMPQIVFITDANGLVQFINDRWEEATGQPVELAPGLGWIDLVLADERDEVKKELARALQDGRELEVEHRLLHADGGYRWRLLRAVPHRSDDGAVVSWYGTSTDIDELKRAQQRVLAQAGELGDLNASLEEKIARRTADLARQEALFRAVAEQAPLPIWTCDNEGELTFFSRAWYELVGGEPPKWLGREWLELVHPDDMAVMVNNWYLSTNTGKPYAGARRIRASDGSYHMMSYRASPVRDASGEISFWVGVEADITELKASEAALRLSNQELESFSYTVSHDLRSPLQRVGSFTQLLGEEIAGTASDRARHFLARIRAGVDQMTQLIDGLLALSQVAQAEVGKTRVDLSVMASDILDRLKAESPARVAITNVEPGLVVWADRALIRSVMENLLENAWKFSSRRGQTEISVGGSVERGEYFVRDNGAGFDMAYASKLFGAFQRLHSDAEFQGTGIGLATVARIIKRHNGRIWAIAEPDHGATFYFTLPAGPIGAA